MATRVAALVAAAGMPGSSAVMQQQMGAANPIRKVVNMLQLMQQKIQAEGEKQEAAFDKFMCYCKNSGGDLATSIQAAETAIEELTASIKADSENRDQTKANLEEHTASRDEAKDTMAKATALRKKEAAAYAKTKSDADTNIAALDKAIPAIANGMEGSFLQTSDASRVRSFAMEKADLADGTREELLAFLSGSQSAGYAPQAGEIVGILKTMHDEMSADLSDATKEEKAALTNFEALMAAKKKEVATLQKQIEEEMTRVGDLSVKLAGAENEIEDTKQSLAEDQKFVQELKTSCSTKEADWELIKQTRAEELTALGETIKVLNDDDALDLFKQTLPSASMSFVQVQVTRASMKSQAQVLVQAARNAAKNGHMSVQPQLNLLALALNGKKAGFEKVLAMITDLVANLGKEQASDDDKLEYCESSLDKAEDKKKTLDNSIADSETAIDEMKGTLEKLTGEIAALTAGIVALDKSVSEATQLRKAENSDFKKLMSDDGTAKELLKFAKNRLNKFYNPKLYKAPPKRQLSEEDQLVENLGGDVPQAAAGGIAGTGIGAVFAQVSAHTQSSRSAPPPPPETFGAYTKKTESGNGVISMIDLLVQDLDKEMQEAEVDEKHAQGEYETMMEESGTKRASDSKSISDMTAEKADTEESLQTEEDKKDGTSTEAMDTAKTIGALHGECDFLIKYHGARKQARADEIDSLNNAKSVLNGANFS